MIWFTSDLHLGHYNVIGFQNRPFETVDEMNEALIRNWNQKVHRNDTVYVLGDITNRCPIEQANQLISRLQGHKILIKGNHDRNYEEGLFEGVYDF